MSDDRDAFSRHAGAWARQARSGENMSHEYIEKPAMYAALPDLAGKRVLCIGCGSGEECRTLKDRGAASVTGIDRSAGLIEIARATWQDITFEVANAENLTYPPDSFDFAYSSLVFHYLHSWTDPLRRIRACLTRGSEILISAHHPVKWGMEKIREKDHFRYRLSYELWGKEDAEIHGDYLSPRQIDEVFFNKIPVSFWHRPFSALWQDIRDSGCAILDIIEPLPINAAKAKKKNFWLAHQKIPQFILFRLQA